MVLSVRPAERWYASFRDTVGALLSLERQPGQVPDVFVPVVDMNKRVIRDHCFGPAFDVDDEERVITAYESHNAAVRAGVESGRLFEFDVADGWVDPCRFLDVTVPDVAFPNISDCEDFQEAVRSRRARARVARAYRSRSTGTALPRRNDSDHEAIAPAIGPKLPQGRAADVVTVVHWTRTK